MSKRFLKNAIYSAHQLIKRTERLSFSSKADYEKELKLILQQLHAGGYQLSHISHLKRRHVDYLIDIWNKQNLNVGTIKNRLAKIRFVCRHYHKEHILPKENHLLSIGNRVYLPERNRALHHFDADKIKNVYVFYSVRLQQEFGLRREESIKFIPSLADKGDRINLKGSWTKGGIPRIIPILHQSQRKLLDEIKQFLSRGESLIPVGKTYRQQKDVYVSQVRQAGYRNLHRLRHAYAQRRYRELTDLLSHGKGWECPLNGGTPAKELSPWQKSIDYEARTVISEELGHSRIEILKKYCL